LHTHLTHHVWMLLLFWLLLFWLLLLLQVGGANYT
jgi:hypothetical protein